MSGNVWEWIWDTSGRTYTEDPVVDPVFVGSMKQSIRGGSWKSIQRYTRTAARKGKLPDEKSGELGFRLVRSILDDPQQ